VSEKILRGGKYFTKDHPHEIINPRVMRFEEIRWWIKELSTNPEWGWVPGGFAGLSRALGYSDANSVRRKLTTAWIWPKEQYRLTARINDIREGFIVPTRLKGGRVEGVYHDPPIPPVVKDKPKSINFEIDVKGRLKVLPISHVHTPPPKMPNFRRAFEEAIYWNPDKK